MLGKVFKYDMKSSSKYFIPLYLGFLAVTLFSKVLLELPNKGGFLVRSIFGLSITTYIVTFIAVALMTQVFIIMHFYKTFITAEGYLTFTLPVKPATHINSKILLGVFWSVLSAIVILLSFVIFAAGHGLNSFFVEFGYICAKFPTDFIGFIIEGVLLVIVSVISQPLLFYASMSVGQLFSKHKVLGAIIAYFGISFITQLIAVVAVFVLGLSTYTITSFYFNGSALVHGYMIFLIALQTLLTVGYYLITYFFISRKLNLE